MVALRIREAQDAGGTVRCVGGIMQITIALHNYYGVYGCYPPAYVLGPDGTRLHSWRVLILPYFGEDGAGLYSKYDFSEPWNGPANRRLALLRPSAFGCPIDAESAALGETNYVVVGGAGTMFDGTNSTREADLVDGTSYTLMVVEVSRAGINWMEPRDLELSTFRIGSPGSNSISSAHRGGAAVAFADGRSRFLPKTADVADVRALLRIRDPGKEAALQRTCPF